MKSAIVLFCLLLSCRLLLAQNNYPLLSKLEIKDKVFQGSIDKYPITIYLTFHQNSNYHMGVYSVKGWYYYDKVKTKIPLVGISTHNELILYHFKDSTISNALLSFEEMKSNHWEDMDYYKNLQNFQEKFILNDSAYYWTNRSKNLKVNLNTNELEIKKVEEYLQLTSNHTFNLHTFGAWTWNFKLVKHKNNRFILNYEHGSRLNVMGMCGAGVEKGYLFLQFDEQFNLISYKQFAVESCLNGIVSNEPKKEPSSILYTCENYQNNKNYRVLVDLINISIKQSEEK